VLAITRRADKAWKEAGWSASRFKKRVIPMPLMIAAGVNAKALSEFMGHSSIQVTLDRYGHLFPGAESEAASLLDALLEGAERQARSATGTQSGTQALSEAPDSASEGEISLPTNPVM
jgi:integrase